MTTRVLLTGAGGFAGAHYLEHVLATTKWKVIATDSFRHKGKTDRIREVLDRKPSWKRRVDVLTHDLTAPFSSQLLDTIEGGEGIDYMVCYASESHVTRSISDPVPFVRNNVDLSLNCLEAARRLSPSRLLWVSTDEVAGPLENKDDAPHKEWCVPSPSNPYSASKAAQEALGFAYWRTYGVPVQIVRCMNMFGERQDPEKFIPLIMSKVVRGEELTIHTSDGGEVGTRNYLHARNLADGINFAMTEHRPSTYPNSLAPEMYNIVAGQQIDNLTVAQMIAEFMGRQLKYRLEPASNSRPGHDPHYGLDPAKMTALGWKPPVPFEESLRRMVEWTLDNPNWLLEG